MKKILIYLISLYFLSTAFLSCDVKFKYNVDIKKNLIDIDNEKLLVATLFHQKAAECSALSYQAYNIARLILDNELRRMSLTKKLAVIVDVDETVLDNSPFQVKIILEKTQYPEYWNEWCELAQAKALPGAVEFLNYTKSIEERSFLVDSLKNEFGIRFIVLPNSMYGAWYETLFKYNCNLTHEEKNKIFYEKLEGF